ncbi:MAG: hypothetical protein Q9163_000741 [Psora crenata]
MVLKYSAAVNRGYPCWGPNTLLGRTTDRRIGRLHLHQFDQACVLGALRLWYATEADSKSPVDVLDTFPTIRVAVAYVTNDGEKLTSFPADLSLLDKCTPEYIEFEGWQSSTAGARTWSHLPPQAQKYIEFIESSVATKVVYIGTGQDREDMIYRE